MTAVTVEYDVSFGDGPGKVERAATEKHVVKPKPKSSATRTARLLALAHHVERLVEDGQLKDYAHAARVLGMTRARMAQVMNLLLLSPGIQEKILAGKLDISERTLRAVVRRVCWDEQDAALASKN